MKKNITFYVATFVLILISSLCVGSVVSGQSSDGMKTKEQYYVELEENYISEIRDLLNAGGYRNSGVMLTRTIFEDGSREYHVNIHHKKLTQLSESEVKKLQQSIEEKAFLKEEMQFVICIK